MQLFIVKVKMKVAKKIYFLTRLIAILVCLTLLACDDEITEDEPDAGDGGCDNVCDDTDWD